MKNKIFKILFILSAVFLTIFIYSNKKNILKSDVIEIDLKTKDTKIFMFENNKKVNIKSKN